MVWQVTLLIGAGVVGFFLGIFVMCLMITAGKNDSDGGGLRS